MPNYALTRGETRLAGFHRLIGVASFTTALCLMLTSVTALHWFAGTIGIPAGWRLLAAIAIEVLAACLAASATTARRGDGRVDWSAWAGFAFFLSLAAAANVLHVLAYIDVSQAPEVLGATGYILVACLFAAACPLGSTWGIHRFGWLRSHSADAGWVDDTPVPVPTVEAPEQPPAAPEPAPAVVATQPDPQAVEVDWWAVAERVYPTLAAQGEVTAEKLRAACAAEHPDATPKSAATFRRYRARLEEAATESDENTPRVHAV